MKDITIITSKYPTKYEPSAVVFIQQLVWAFANMGIKCTVICPIASNIEVEKGIKLPKHTVEYTDMGSKIRIYYPRFLGFGQQDLKILNTANLTLHGFTKAVFKTIKEMPEKPSIVYGHFVSPSGIVAARVGKEFNIPAFLAYGESSPWSIYNVGVDKVQKELKSLSGVIAVSTKNEQDLVNLNVVEKDKIEVFPNGYRSKRFYPRDKKKSREKFGLPQDEFIVSFVGSYDDRKGIKRIEKAIDGLDDVYLISAGKGKLAPESKKCLYSGTVHNEDLPYFYCASDAFVLPTLNEGCSNAIIEAIACGLPIISSDLPFNEDILDDSNSILVDPHDVRQIKDALSTLKDNKNNILERLHKGSLAKSNELTLNIRANKILQFIDNKVETHES